jgi:hypothetical protein
VARSFTATAAMIPLTTLSPCIQFYCTTSRWRVTQRCGTAEIWCERSKRCEGEASDIFETLLTTTKSRTATLPQPNYIKMHEIAPRTTYSAEKLEMAVTTAENMTRTLGDPF